MERGASSKLKFRDFFEPPEIPVDFSWPGPPLPTGLTEVDE